MGRKRIDLIGKRFKTFTVISFAGKTSGILLWLCRCDCGFIREFHSKHLRAGSIRCQCNAKTNHPLYCIWRKMLERCYSESSDSYYNYGARGITVCDRWLIFENFRDDMSPRPSGKTLDRLDNSKGYSPENCQWSTNKEQNSNTRRNVYLTHNGETLHMADWADKLGISREAMRQRIANKLPDDRLFFKGRMWNGGYR